MASFVKISSRSFSASQFLRAGPGAPHGDAGWKRWRIISLTVVPVVLVLGHINAFYGVEEPARPEFKKYEYLHIRTKKFPWGDGNHSLFHNPHVNALPEGYEDELD